MDEQSEELKRKIAQAKVLATLEDHPGWKIIVDNLEAQIANNRDALCQIGMDHEKTEGIRRDIRIMQWCRNSTLLATPEQFELWEAALAKREEKAKMIADRGLPPGGR